MYASIFYLKGENAFKPIFTVWTILSAMPFDWGWYGDVLYGIHPIFLNHNTKLSSQNSSVLSVTMVLDTPFLANIVLNIGLTVVAFQSLTFITSSQPENKSTKINDSEMCALSIWTLVHGALPFGYVCILVCLNVLITVYLGHLLMYSSISLQYPSHQACNLNLLCVAATAPWISSCTLLITTFLKIWGGTVASALNIKLSLSLIYVLLLERSILSKTVTPYILSYAFKYSALPIV